MPKRPPTFRPFGVTPKQIRQGYDQQRGKDRQFYSTRQWKAFRKRFLSCNPLCVRCQAEATDVHHKRPRREYPDLAWDEDNLEALCGTCHKRHEAIKRSRRG